MNRDTHLPSPEVVDWLLDQKWSDVIPVTAITYPNGNPDGVTESERFDYCSATVAIGADECCHLQLPVEALEVLRSDQARRVAIRAATPAPLEGEVEELIQCLRIRAASLGAEGASLGQRGDACYFTRAADMLEQLSAAAPAVVPVPMSERLPGPKDCDAEGSCWFWSSEDQCWFWERLDSDFCRRYCVEFDWLPAHALPLPSGEVEG